MYIYNQSAGVSELAKIKSYFPILKKILNFDVNLQNLFHIKVYSVGTYQKKFQLNQSGATPQYLSQHFQSGAQSWKLEMLAEVLGCCTTLIELTFFLVGPNTIYFDMKKVLEVHIKV